MKNNNCNFCNLSSEDKKWQIYENDFWIVFMADKQDYLGRCLIMSKRHIAVNKDISMDEWISLRDIIGGLEELLKNEFGAELINWSCLMNDAYKQLPPSPHLHFHVRPRYRNSIHMFGYEFVDEEFAHHYNNNKDDISDELKQKIFEYLKENIHKYLEN